MMRGSGQGFGFAIGVMIGFGLVAYLSSKAVDAKVSSWLGAGEAWLVEQTERLNQQAGEGNLPS